MYGQGVPSIVASTRTSRLYGNVNAASQTGGAPSPKAGPVTNVLPKIASSWCDR